MGLFQQGDIVIVDFPFSEGDSVKTRPAVVASTDEYHSGRADIIIIAVTFQAPLKPRSTDYELQHWLAEGLDKPSWVRGKLYTVHQARVRGTIGKLGKRDFNGVKRCLSRAFGLD